MAAKKEHIKFFGPSAQARQENEDLSTKSGFHQDPFWQSTPVDEIRVRWDQVWPYQLIIIKKINGKYTSNGIMSKFTLPMPPQQLTVDMPFAINFGITMGGAIEEHNGTPIRNISLSGTTGVFQTPETTGIAKTLNLGEAIFAGTIRGVNQIEQARESLLGIEGNAPRNVYTESQIVDGDAKLYKATGFYQFALLERFLEGYAALKKTEAGRDARLALAIWKENSVFLVKPNNLTRQRSSNSPHKYNYTLNLVAWRRITLDESPTEQFITPLAARNPSVFAQVLNTLTNSRRLLAGVQSTLKGFRADIQNTLYRPLREAILLGKDVLGVGITAVELPGNIIKDFREPILELAGAANSFGNPRLGSRGLASIDAGVAAVEEAFRQLSIATGKAETKGGQSAVAVKRQELDSAGRGGGPNSSNAAPANKIIEAPEDNFDFFETIRPGDLNLRPSTIRAIEEERRRVQLLRREDFEAYRDNTLEIMATFAASVGATSAMYNQTYDLPLPTSSKLEPSDDDWEILFTLNNVAASFDALSVSADINNPTLDSMEYVAGLASRSGIAFRVPKSKFAVPFPYSYTLEQLSAQYLGTPDRWLEIATLNGLQSPYVDEIGWSKELLTNGAANQVTVATSDDLFVGQVVWIGSRTVRREKRRVQKIQVVGGNTVVHLDGVADLAKYAVIAGATLQGFKPNTVNSQQTIFIPSDTEPEEQDYRIKQIPGIDYFDPLVKSGGIDLLLDPNGDIVVTPDGDARFAVGLTNFIQRIKIAFGTKRGSLIRHPEFGLGLTYGTSLADISAQDVLTEAKRLLADEPGISGVQSASVRINGSSLSIRIAVTLAATDQVVPVQLDLDV